MSHRVKLSKLFLIFFFKKFLQIRSTVVVVAVAELPEGQLDSAAIPELAVVVAAAAVVAVEVGGGRLG